MPRIAFVTDSTAFISEELRNHPDVIVVPIIIISEGQEYKDGVELSSDQLYEIIRTDKKIPKTSQPSMGQFADLYEMLKEDYDQAIAIHISNKLSGAVSSSNSGKDHAGFDVEVIDSLSISYGMTILLEKGLKLAEQGGDAKTIADELRGDISHLKNLVLLGSLEQLYKGGRMSGAQFLVGNILQIKPILNVNSEGELVLYERIRSEKKAVSRVIELFKEDCEKNSVQSAAIMHGNVPEKAEEIKSKIQADYPNLNLTIGEISSSVAVHVGEGTVALFWTTR
ncbi:DegV family protein [Bacillaceae bacterium S4-13-58]